MVVLLSRQIVESPIVQPNDDVVESSKRRKLAWSNGRIGMSTTVIQIQLRLPPQTHDFEIQSNNV